MLPAASWLLQGHSNTHDSMGNGRPPSTTSAGVLVHLFREARAKRRGGSVISGEGEGLVVPTTQLRHSIGCVDVCQ